MFVNISSQLTCNMIFRQMHNQKKKKKENKKKQTLYTVLSSAWKSMRKWVISNEKQESEKEYLKLVWMFPLTTERF